MVQENVDVSDRLEFHPVTYLPQLGNVVTPRGPVPSL